MFKVVGCHFREHSFYITAPVKEETLLSVSVTPTVLASAKGRNPPLKIRSASLVDEQG